MSFQTLIPQRFSWSWDSTTYFALEVSANRLKKFFFRGQHLVSLADCREIKIRNRNSEFWNVTDRLKLKVELKLKLNMDLN